MIVDAITSHLEHLRGDYLRNFVRATSTYVLQIYSWVR